MPALLLADRFGARLRGLLWREPAPGEGMLLTHTTAIHTALMRRALDVVFLDTALCVVRMERELKPWRMASQWGARFVLELAAGECARHQVEVGDRLRLSSEPHLNV